MSTEQTGGAGLENSNNPVNAPQQDGQTGQIALALPQRPSGIFPEYLDPGAWEFPSSDLDNAEDLSAAQWTKILRINKALYGFTIREKEKDIVKARFPAFSLLAPASATTTLSPDVTPEFEVWDSSSISIKETATDLQRSLAINGFSSQSIEAAFGGGAFGSSAGISADLKAQSSTAEGEIKSRAEKEYYAAYNFPRARLFLNKLNLQLSPQYERALKDLKLDPTDQKLRRFSELYGHIFATVFQLGGQLQSSKFAGSMLLTSETERADALKAAVGASFGAQYVSGSARYSRETQRGSHKQEQRISDLSNLAWTARGGNTLLCANPPQCASTVASHKNWRVIEQEKVITLHELIGRFSDWNEIPELFEDIAQKRIAQNQLTSNVKPKWTGRIKLLLNPWMVEPLKLASNDLDTQTLTVAPSGDSNPASEPVFTVLNANKAEKSDLPVLSSFPTDYPVFLIVASSYQRSSEKGGQIPGLFVNSLGQLKPENVPPSDINRFSFRLAGSGGQWKRYDAQPLETLKSGDQVNIYCHSLGVGSYANIENPPRRATPIQYSAANRKIAVFLEDHAKSDNTRSIIQKYDYDALNDRDRDAFELKGYISPTDRVGKIKPEPSFSMDTGGLSWGVDRSAGSISAGVGVAGVPVASFSVSAKKELSLKTALKTREWKGRLPPQVSAGGGPAGAIGDWTVKFPGEMDSTYRVATFTVLFE